MSRFKTQESKNILIYHEKIKINKNLASQLLIKNFMLDTQN